MRANDSRQRRILRRAAGDPWSDFLHQMRIGGGIAALILLLTLM